MEYYDLPAIRKITREAAAHGYRWSSIVESIVQSAPFQMSTTKATARAESSNRRTAE
jgi:hypothetical protein